MRYYCRLVSGRHVIDKVFIPDWPALAARSEGLQRGDAVGDLDVVPPPGQVGGRVGRSRLAGQDGLTAWPQLGRPDLQLQARRRNWEDILCLLNWHHESLVIWLASGGIHTYSSKGKTHIIVIVYDYFHSHMLCLFKLLFTAFMPLHMLGHVVFVLMTTF